MTSWHGVQDVDADGFLLLFGHVRLS
jgi:hypothetical protein